MKAAVFQEPGKPFTIETVKDPTPESSDLIIKVGACGVCGSDLHMTEPKAYLNPPCGSILGHEFCGEVVEVGKDMKTKWKPGDRLVTFPIITCGACKYCMEGKLSYCKGIKGVHGVKNIAGAFAEYTRVSGFESVRLPNSLSYGVGACIEPLAVGLEAVRSGKLQPHDEVLILGAGPIGNSILLWARFFGIENIVVTETNPHRAKIAKRLGAKATIDPKKVKSLEEEYQSITGRLPSIIFEAVGRKGMMQTTLNMAAKYSRVVFVGACMQPEEFTMVTANLKVLDAKFSYGYNRHDLNYVADILERGGIDISDWLTNSVSLEQLPKAFEEVRGPEARALKVLYTA